MERKPRVEKAFQQCLCRTLIMRHSIGPTEAPLEDPPPPPPACCDAELLAPICSHQV